MQIIKNHLNLFEFSSSFSQDLVFENMEQMTEMFDALELGRVYYTISLMTNKVRHSAQIILKNSIFLDQNIKDLIALYSEETKLQAENEKV